MSSYAESVQVRVLPGQVVEAGAGRVHGAGTILWVSRSRAEEWVDEGRVGLVAAGARQALSRGELRTLRGMRAAPFLAVVLCFLLPFFTAASCGGGVSTTATGLDVVTGKRLVAQQTQQPLCLVEAPATCPPPVRLGAAGGDPVAQAVSHASQPWAIAALVLVLAGACLVVAMSRFWRVASLVTAGAALVALLRMGEGLHARAEDISWGAGPTLAILILLATIIWVGVLAIKTANANLATTPVPVGPAIQGLDLRRRGGEPTPGEAAKGAKAWATAPPVGMGWRLTHGSAPPAAHQPC